MTPTHLHEKGSPAVGLGLLCGVLLLGVGCLVPNEERPGLRLTGNTQPRAVEDWQFLADRYQLFLETRSWYGIRHSVTTACLIHDGVFYIPSPNADSKRWVRNVARDPRVRVKVDRALFELRATRMEDATLSETLLEGLVEKYEVYAGMHSKGVPIAFFRMDPAE